MLSYDTIFYRGDNMKKWFNKQTIIAFILGAFLFSVADVGAASFYQFALSTDTLYVDGIKVDKPLYGYNGSNYLPLRATADVLGLNVAYNNKRINLTSPKTDIESVSQNVESCVLIRIYSTDNVNTAKLAGTASGAMLDNGIIVTNKHVLDFGKMYGIQYNDTSSEMNYTATQSYSINTNLDIGFLKSPMPGKAVKIGDSSKLRIGQDVVIISSPGGLKNNITKGIVSGLSDQKDGQIIQVNADISRGASGGGIFNMNGELIGILAAGLTEDMKYNYVIPINSIKPLIEGLK